MAKLGEAQVLHALLRALPAASRVTGLKYGFRVTKHFLLSLWSGFEEVKGTHRITRKMSSSFLSGKGKGQMKEVRQHPRWVIMGSGRQALPLPAAVPALVSRDTSWGPGGRGGAGEGERVEK